MSESNWRDVLKSQQEDLKRLQLNAAVEDDLDADIERILSKPSTSMWMKKTETVKNNTNSNAAHEDYEINANQDSKPTSASKRTNLPKPAGVIETIPPVAPQQEEGNYMHYCFIVILLDVIIHCRRGGWRISGWWQQCPNSKNG